MEARTGGAYTLAWHVTADGFGYVTSGVIEEISAGALRVGSVVYLNPERPILGPMSITVTAEATRLGCRLTVLQDGYREGPDWDWYYDSVQHAWPLVLTTLSEYAETEGRGADSR